MNIKMSEKAKCLLICFGIPLNIHIKISLLFMSGITVKLAAERSKEVQKTKKISASLDHEQHGVLKEAGI